MYYIGMYINTDIMYMYTCINMLLFMRGGGRRGSLKRRGGVHEGGGRRGCLKRRGGVHEGGGRRGCLKRRGGVHEGGGRRGCLKRSVKLPRSP